MSKGSQVYIEGKLRQENYIDRDGNQRSSLQVTATDVQFLGSPGQRSESTNNQSAPEDEEDIYGGSANNDIPF